MQNNQTINKLKLINLVSKRLNYQIHKSHISNIVSLFVDEFFLELKTNRKIEIINFCSFSLHKSKPRKYHDFFKSRMAVSKGKTYLRIILTPELRNEIVNNLDLIKTFLKNGE